MPVNPTCGEIINLVVKLAFNDYFYKAMRLHPNHCGDALPYLDHRFLIQRRVLGRLGPQEQESVKRPRRLLNCSRN